MLRTLYLYFSVGQFFKHYVIFYLFSLNRDSTILWSLKCAAKCVPTLSIRRVCKYIYIYFPFVIWIVFCAVCSNRSIYVCVCLRDLILVYLWCSWCVELENSWFEEPWNNSCNDSTTFMGCIENFEKPRCI